MKAVIWASLNVACLCQCSGCKSSYLCCLCFCKNHCHALKTAREREKLYIFSSHLGLIRCLTPVRVSAIIYFQAFLDNIYVGTCHGGTWQVPASGCMAAETEHEIFGF